ncbi:MAG: mechanosensitive ion channel family protein [Muribaculum sp.]|nr:mechanosensitive ion channel family protein [Muribaculum sp.]
MNQLDDFLIAIGIPEDEMAWTTRIIILGIVLIVTVGIDYLCRNVVTKIIHRIIKKTDTKWDDYLLNDNVLNNLWHLLLPVIVFFFVPAILRGLPTIEFYVSKLLLIYIIGISVRLVCAVLSGAYEGALTRKGMENHPLKGIYQMLKLVVIGIGVIIAVSTMLSKNPITILTGLGAAATVLMLVFKDSILGLVAGIQLTLNDMLKVGDWITIPARNANGIVREVTLTTVKVQNYDNTIITIPPYYLISESFQNWRGMQLSGGRRVMRALNIDINTVRFAKEKEIRHFIDLGWIDESDLPSDRRIVNLHIFRRYAERYLASHPDVLSKEMLLMVRQLDPTTQGLPIQLYFFTSATEWKAYETIAADIFDHIIAMINEFGLRIFQAPAGADINRHLDNPVLERQ